MGTNSRSGIIANVKHFAQLQLSVQTFGLRYNPSNPSITLTALKGLGEKVNASIESTGKILVAHTQAATDRKDAFKPFPKLVTQAKNAFETCGVSGQLLVNVRSYVYKLRGQRITPLITADEKAALEAEGKSSVQHSVSQKDYDSLTENFGKMLDIFETVPEYAPNEEELQTPNLRARYHLLKVKNTAVLTAEVALHDAYSKRNALFNDKVTGMVDIATTVKKYVKSVFTANSDQYRSIAGLKFTIID